MFLKSKALNPVLHKAFFFFLFIVLGANYNSAFGSHAMGGDLTFECLGGNQYRINLVMYRDCDGVDFDSVLQISFESQSCGYSSTTVSISRTSITEVSDLCPSELTNSSCNGGSLPGTEVHLFSEVITLPDQCNDWIISHYTNVRNDAITNLYLGHSQPFYIEALINNLDVSCNNSPTFDTSPVPYICVGKEFNYNHGAVDSEGDSIVYNLIAPLRASQTPIPYETGFSVNTPIDVIGSFAFDSASGQITFTPRIVQNAVLAVQVQEYRNGILISSTIRDMQVVVRSCSNNPPEVSDLLGLTGATNDGNIIYSCEGSPISFGISATDLDASDIISITHTITSNLPGAVVSITGTNPATINVSWTIPSGGIPNYSFTVKFQDDNCTFLGSQIVGYTIRNVEVTLSKDIIEKCPDDTIVTALGASYSSPGTYSWSPATGLSCTNCPNPTATISSPITYSVTFTDSVTGCAVSNSVEIADLDYVLDVSQSSSQYCPGDTAVLLDAVLRVDGQEYSSGIPGFSGGVFSRNGTTDCSGTTLNYNHQMVFTNLVPPTSDVTLTFCIEGDYGLALIEEIEIFGEDGVSLGEFDEPAGANYPDCGSPGLCFSIVIPIATWNTWSSDGQVIFTGVPSDGVNYSCSGNYSCVTSAVVEYTANPSNTANYQWTPSAGLSNDTISNPIATPPISTFYTVTASDGICTLTETIPITCDPLNLSCLSFSADHNESQNAVHLDWILSEMPENDQLLQLQRSVNGNEFTTIKEIQNPVAFEYSFIDKLNDLAPQSLYYRLNFAKSKFEEDMVCNTLKVNFSDDSDIKATIAPNPNNGLSQLIIDSDEQELFVLTIYDSKGRAIMDRNEIQVQQGKNQFPLNLNGYGTGIYFVRIESSPGNHRELMRLVVQ